MKHTRKAMSYVLFCIDNILTYYTVTTAGVIVHELGHLFTSKLLGGTLVSLKVNPLTETGNCKCSFTRLLRDWEHLLIELSGPLFGVAYSVALLRNFREYFNIILFASIFCTNQLSNLLPFEDTTDSVRLWDCIRRITNTKFEPWKIRPYGNLFALIGSSIITYYNL